MVLIEGDVDGVEERAWISVFFAVSPAPTTGCWKKAEEEVKRDTKGEIEGRMVSERSVDV